MNEFIEIEKTDWIDAPDFMPDRHEFIIGDVHGRILQLNSIIHEMSKFETEHARLTFLGDLINRGPDSIGCMITAVSDGDGKFAGKRNILLGNHEIMMIRSALPIPYGLEAFEVWRLGAGGEQMIDEFATPKTTHKTLKNDIALAIAKRVGYEGDLDVGLEILNQVWNAPIYIESGNMLMVHAGIPPYLEKYKLSKWMDRDRSIHELPFNEDLPVKIRYPFLDYVGPFHTGHFVVHGHTPEHGIGPKGWDETPHISHHVLKGCRLSLDGHYDDDGAVVGAEILPGKYRIYRAPNSAKVEKKVAA